MSIQVQVEVRCSTEGRAEEPTNLPALAPNSAKTAASAGLQTSLPSLPAADDRYMRVHQRLAGFRRGNPAFHIQAWNWLMKWKMLLSLDSEWSLPPPLVFASEEGAVVFEWVTTARELQVSLEPDGRVGYVKASLPGSQEEALEEGSVAPEQVCELLAWFASASAATLDGLA